MEVALVSMATGALNSVLEKLGTLLGDEYNHFKGVRKEIKFLIDELAALHALLTVMSADDCPNEKEKVWMTVVRELSYDMEDSIDDIMQSVNEKDTKPEGFIEHMMHSLGKLRKMKARCWVGKENQILKTKLIEVSDRNERNKTGVPIFNTYNAAVDPRALAIFEEASKLVEIDIIREELIQIMAEGASTQDLQRIVSIVLSEGNAKTTIANQLYEYFKGKFQCRVVLSVSQNTDMINILRTILTEVRGQGYANTEAGSIEQIISKIKDFLSDKRYFVVVDDICDMYTWDVIKHAFPVTSSGSLIITTTRKIAVAKSCSSLCGNHIYIIDHLNMVSSRQLFHKRLFKSNEDCPSHLEIVFDKILQKCDGLPLAIITMSGLLANRERTEDLWNQVEDSIDRALHSNLGVKLIMKILSVSYFDLPPHLKCCLLYMSIFPEDFIIEKKCLIRRWICEGFIHKEDIYTVYEIGERCFNELLNRSLILPVKTSENGTVKTCRVHTTILDFIISKSIEENFVTIGGVPSGSQSNVARRLSVQDVKQINSTIETDGLVLSHVRSLNVFPGSMEIPSFEEFKHLRVLDLKNCHQLKDHHLTNIMRFSQLRYLNLGDTEIPELPEQIGRLGCLEILNLRGTLVKELPASIVNLGKLSHIFVNYGNVKFPVGIAKMQALEKLNIGSIYVQPIDLSWGLGQLKNLRSLFLDLSRMGPWPAKGDSCTKDTEDEEQTKKVILSSLCKLGTLNLRSLTVQHGSSLLLEDLCLVTLEKLITRYSPVPQVPKWVSSLRNVRHVLLEVEGVKQNDLCILGALPSLLILHLKEEQTKEVAESRERLIISGEVGFRFLRIFSYDGNKNLVDLMFVEGSMPKLEKLTIVGLLVFEAQSHSFGIQNLPCLMTVVCNVHGHSDIVGAVYVVMKKAVRAHPNHPALTLPELGRFRSEDTSSIDQLILLKIAEKKELSSGSSAV